jgi:hypothetical protein
VIAGRVFAASHPALVERWYARGVYPLVARVASAVTGYVPFSVAEMSVALGVVGLALALARAWRRRRQRGRKPPLAVRVARLLGAAALVVLAFDVLWGFNYDRQPVSDLLGYDMSPGRPEELASLASGLLAEAARLREGLPEDAAGTLRLPDGRRAVRRASLGYAAGALERLPVPALPGHPKMMVLSPLMSYLGITGIFIPFTFEANVNGTLPDWEVPFTACHELAHQRGFAREEEANYVAYLACRAHPDRDFRYSGAFRAALYALVALAGADRAAYGPLRAGLPAPLGRDLAALAAWRTRYESRWADVQEKVNDAYLKTQGQAEGVRSYGRMVDLLLAERRAQRQEEAGQAR